MNIQDTPTERSPKDSSSTFMVSTAASSPVTQSGSHRVPSSPQLKHARTAPDLPAPADYENDARNTPERSPWKFIGYKVFTRWLASDNSLFIFRRFGALNARVALALQNELVDLEEQLQILDDVASTSQSHWNVNNGSFERDPLKERRDLVTKMLPEKLTAYNAFINSYSQLVNRQKIHPDDLAQVRQWMACNDQAIDPKEAKFITENDDLIGLCPKPRSRFQKFLDHTILLVAPRPIRKIFQRTPRDEMIRQTPDQTIWADYDKVEGLSKTAAVVGGLGMLLGPLWILAYVESLAHRLGIITGFIVLFFFVVFVCTNCTPFNALAAAAAYSAVLMVFIQMVPT